MSNLIDGLQCYKINVVINCKIHITNTNAATLSLTFKREAQFAQTARSLHNITFFGIEKQVLIKSAQIIIVI